MAKVNEVIFELSLSDWEIRCNCASNAYDNVSSNYLETAVECSDENGSKITIEKRQWCTGIADIGSGDVATVAFPNELNYTEVGGVNRGYHACTHNGKNEGIVDELVSVESFQISRMSRFLKRLDEIDEPGLEGSMFDHTLVLFGSGMGYGGTHSNRRGR